MSKAKIKTRAAWTFFSNHGHVLVCIAQDSEMLLREVADLVGITERAVQRIIHELEEEGYLKKAKTGRRNNYQVIESMPLRHQLESHCKIGALLKVINKNNSK